MSPFGLYAASASATVAIAVVEAFGASEPVRRLLAINIAYSGVFLVFVAIARRAASGLADPIPHALVLTGIVVSVSSTVVALALTRRLVKATRRGAGGGSRPTPGAPEPRDP